MAAGEAEVDLEALEVRFAGRAVPFELDAERRHRLLNGLDDIALTLQKADEIAAYEATRERPAPSRLRSVAGPQSSCPTIALLPGDGIGPEVAAAAVEVLNAVATDLDLRGAPGRRRRHRRARHRRSPTRRSRPARRPTRSCSAPSAARSGTRTSPARSRPEQGLFGLRADLGLYANLRPIRPLPRALRRVAAQARADRGRRHADRARAHRRPLLRRARHASDDRAFDTMVYTRRRRSSGSSARRSRPREVARDERRQGQRARHLAGCGARSSPASTPRSSRTSSSSTCSSTRARCS